MARTKQTARKALGKAPRKTLARPQKQQPIQPIVPNIEYYKDPSEFHSETYGYAFHRQFKELHESKRLCDLKIRLSNDKELDVHKVILAASSDILRDYLLNPNNFITPNQIALLQVDSKLFESMVRYIYTGEIAVQQQDVLPLLELSFKFGLHSLKEQCSEILGAKISDDNLETLLNICRSFDCKKLRRKCAQFIGSNFPKFQTQSALFSIELDLLEEILKSDFLEVNKEEEVYDLIIKYTNNIKNENDRMKALERLLPLVRFSQLDGRFLVSKVAEDVIPSMHNILFEVYKYKTCPEVVLSKHDLSEESARRLKPRISYSRIRKCKKCGNDYTLFDNTNCQFHTVACTCTNPTNYYDNNFNGSCCCGGCGASCSNCGDCKCAAPCQVGKHEEYDLDDTRKRPSPDNDDDNDNF